MGLKPTVGLNVSLCQISPPPAGLNERYTLTLSHMNSPPLRFLSSLRSHDGHDHLLMFNHGNCSTFRSDVTSTNLCVCVCVRGCACAEGLPHSVPGAGAGESEGGAGDQEQPAAPEGEEAHGDGQTGQHQLISFTYSHL